MTKKETKNFVSNALLAQFNRHWNMLEQAIEKYPQELWFVDEGDWTYSYIIFHILETTKFYIAKSPDEMEWGKRASIDWEKDSKEKITEAKSKITKEFLLEYMEELKEDTSNLLEKLSIEELDNKEGFHWFESVLEKLLYLLRHNSVHLGELAKTLRDKNLERMIWT
jgi:hypothetical protein